VIHAVAANLRNDDSLRLLAAARFISLKASEYPELSRVLHLRDRIHPDTGSFLISFLLFYHRLPLSLSLSLSLSNLDRFILTNYLPLQVRSH